MAVVNPGSASGERVRLNVGGKLFETTLSTVQSAGPDSLLAALSIRSIKDPSPVFIDRDPEIFSVLLSLLRSDRLPSAAGEFSCQELADEALYYGVESRLRSALSPPPLNGIDASRTATIRPAADRIPSDFTVSGDSSVWIAHGGQVSVYDWNLSHAATVRTHLDDIASICRIWPEISALGSESAPGLHVYDLAGGRHVGSVHWTDPTDPRVFKARVAAVADSPSAMYAAFDCPHRENSILQIDKSTLQVTSVLARQNGSSAKSNVPGKLMWLPQNGLLMGSSVTCGAFGFSGYVRFWDPTSGAVVWETNEPGSGRSSRFGDAFADITVDAQNSKLFKVCSRSGDVAFADLRKLTEDPWIYLEDRNPRISETRMTSSVIHCYKGQVFLGRDGELEVWSRVGDDDGSIDEGIYARNFVDKEGDSERGIIKKIECGGDRLFVSRENVEGVEVWESSHLSGAVQPES